MLSVVALLLCRATWSAEALPLRICVSSEPAGPFTYPDREGLSHRVIRAAAGQVGFAVTFLVKPRVRCLFEAKAGKVDALAMAGSTSELVAALAYPMQGQKLDGARGFGPYSAYLVRLRSAEVVWDGSRISGASLPILYPAGMTAARDRLREVGALGSESFKSARTMVHLLLNRRAQAVILREVDALAVTQDPVTREQLELLQPPFFTINIYVPFNRTYYRAHRELVEAFWLEIGRQAQRER